MGHIWFRIFELCWLFYKWATSRRRPAVQHQYPRQPTFSCHLDNASVITFSNIIKSSIAPTEAICLSFLNWSQNKIFLQYLFWISKTVGLICSQVLHLRNFWQTIIKCIYASIWSKYSIKLLSEYFHFATKYYTFCFITSDIQSCMFSD